MSTTQTLNPLPTSDPEDTVLVNGKPLPADLNLWVAAPTDPGVTSGPVVSLDEHDQWDLFVTVRWGRTEPRRPVRTFDPED